MELILRFGWWAHQLHRFPCVQQIVDHFGVSRATAYRWRQAFAASRGIVAPPDTSIEHDAAPAGDAIKHPPSRRSRRHRSTQ